jgi:hypothetical protein
MSKISSGFTSWICAEIHLDMILIVEFGGWKVHLDFWFWTGWHFRKGLRCHVIDIWETQRPRVCEF